MKLLTEHEVETMSDALPGTAEARVVNHGFHHEHSVRINIDTDTDKDWVDDIISDIQARGYKLEFTSYGDDRGVGRDDDITLAFTPRGDNDE